MSDSPINFMLYGHTPSFQSALESKGALLKAELFELMSSLTNRKQQNLRYLKQMDNQQQTISSLNFQIEYQTRKREDMLKSMQQKQLQSQHQLSKEMAKYRVGCKSTQIPNKHAYLDINNKSIESSFEHRVLDKKNKMELRDVRLKLNSTAISLRDKKSQSLARFKFK